MIYADTGVVTKWYLPEADSADAVALRNRYSPPAILTSLHRLELANAWRLKVFRQELSESAFQLARENFLDDIHAGLWYCPAEPLVEVYTRAEALALAHTAAIGTRSLDILHVAMAEILQSSHFITGDQRQAQLARLVNLSVIFHKPS